MKKVLVTFAFLAAVCAVLMGGYALHQWEQQKTEVEETAGAPLFDTTYLEQWCGEPNGTVRMVGGWLFNYEPSSGIYTVEDESGNLWCVTYEEGAIHEDDFLLLWIDNNETPDYQTDDTVVKVWREAH